MHIYITYEKHQNKSNHRLSLLKFALKYSIPLPAAFNPAGLLKSGSAVTLIKMFKGYILFVLCDFFKLKNRNHTTRMEKNTRTKVPVLLC